MVCNEWWWCGVAWWFVWTTQNQFISKYEYCIDFYWHEVLQMHYNQIWAFRMELLQLIIYSILIMKVFCVGRKITNTNRTWIHHLLGLRRVSIWINYIFHVISLASIRVCIQLNWYILITHSSQRFYCCRWIESFWKTILVFWLDQMIGFSSVSIDRIKRVDTIVLL